MEPFHFCCAVPQTDCFQFDKANLIQFTMVQWLQLTFLLLHWSSIRPAWSSSKGFFVMYYVTKPFLKTKFEKQSQYSTLAIAP